MEEINKMTEGAPDNVSRRNFIKGVIATGAAARPPRPTNSINAAARARALAGSDDDSAGRHLLRLGDRVLEVEDHVVRAAAEHLLDLARMVAGGEEEAAEGGHGRSPVRGYG